MTRNKRGKHLKNWNSNQAQAPQGKLRIIGGTFRGRIIDYSGDPVTRPMKDNIREALFNLVGGWVKEKVVFDLFAATAATMIERHFPTVKIIEQNIQTLDVSQSAQVHASDTFFWVRKFIKEPTNHPTSPWMVFCCPPYDFFVDRTTELMTMLNSLIALAPPESIFVVESDRRFEHAQLPLTDEWVIREYSPAAIATLKR